MSTNEPPAFELTGEDAEWGYEFGVDGLMKVCDVEDHLSVNRMTSLYRKIAAVWARVAQAKGTIRSEEGETEYEPGDYVAFHAPDAELGWAVTPVKFLERYDVAPEASEDPEE